jgi:hypothetical protein
MGSIMTRKTKNGRASYTARVRRQGEPHLTATFYRKADAVRWVQETEIAIQRRRYFGDELSITGGK